MSEVSERYAAIGDGFTRRVGGVPPSHWDVPSPCADWTAREIVEHVVNTHARVLASLDGSDPVPVSGEDDLVSAWPRATNAVRGALQDPARAGVIVGGMFGEQPFESVVGRLLCADTLIHTWDLARATGQDESLDPGAVAKANRVPLADRRCDSPPGRVWPED